MSRSPLGSVREVSPGIWRLEVPAGRNPVTGKRQRPNKTVRGDERDARLEYARMLLNVGKMPVSDLTLSEYVNDIWTPSLSVRRLTKDGYESKMRLHILPVLGSVRLNALEPYMLDRWVAGLPKTRTGLHAYRVLHGALRRAVKWRLIEVNPLDAVDAPRPASVETEVLTADEANAYLDAFAGHELEPIVVLALAGGLRRSELCALEWADVDLKAATVRITKGKHEDKGEVWIEQPKSVTSRRLVSLPAWAVEALKVHRGIGPLTTLKPSVVLAHYRRHIESVEDLRYVPLKQLRHTSATLALANGVDVVTVSRRLGHSTVTVTDQYYLRPGRAADELAAAAMNNLRTRRPDGQASTGG